MSILFFFCPKCCKPGILEDSIDNCIIVPTIALQYRENVGPRINRGCFQQLPNFLCFSFFYEFIFFIKSEHYLCFSFFCECLFFYKSEHYFCFFFVGKVTREKEGDIQRNGLEGLTYNQMKTPKEKLLGQFDKTLVTNVQVFPV